MKKLIFFFLISMYIVSGLLAKNNSGFLFSIHTGISKPVAPKSFLNSYRAGANFGIGIGKKIFSNFTLYGNICYNEFTFDQIGFKKTLESPDEVVTVEGGGASILNFLVKTRFTFPHKSDNQGISYVYGSLGINRVSEKQLIVICSEFDKIISRKSENVIGTEFGLGIEILLKNTNLFIELGLNLSFTKDKETTFLPIKFGIRF